MAAPSLHLLMTQSRKLAPLNTVRYRSQHDMDQSPLPQQMPVMVRVKKGRIIMRIKLRNWMLQANSRKQGKLNTDVHL